LKQVFRQRYVYEIPWGWCWPFNHSSCNQFFQARPAPVRP
jgi:hypothetical protein